MGVILHEKTGDEKEIELHPGDLIKCRDVTDYMLTDFELRRHGYETEIANKVNGEAGIWIEIRGRKDGEKIG